MLSSHAIHFKCSAPSDSSGGLLLLSAFEKRIEILMQLQKDWMHRWSILLFLSFFSPIFSTSLFLFSSLLHLAQPLFLSFSSFLSCLILLSFLHCVTSSYSLLFVFYIILFSCYCLLFSSLLSPLLIVSSPLILHFLFFPLPSSYSHHFSPRLILLSPIFSISPHLSSYFLLSHLIALSFSALHLFFLSPLFLSLPFLISSLLPLILIWFLLT